MCKLIALESPKWVVFMDEVNHLPRIMEITGECDTHFGNNVYIAPRITHIYGGGFCDIAYPKNPGKYKIFAFKEDAEHCYKMLDFYVEEQANLYRQLQESKAEMYQELALQSGHTEEV